ncbi:MAG TPA: DUF3035 domain-containing protein [Rhodospirillaceae bacterium]|nr:DUF3035 domain-containing protein [Rhodospirillaceae bacterium]
MQYLPRLILLASVLVLAACGGVAESLGLGRNPPDEFAVVDRPPLSLPPEFELRPPRPGAVRPQAVSVQDKAETTLFGECQKEVPESDVEKELLTKAGADKADPDIRALIDNESSQKVVGSRHLVDEILWWKEAGSDATTVDAIAEAERLRKAKKDGSSITSGATPVIERNKSSWLGL